MASSCLDVASVSGYIRVPLPPASTSPFIVYIRSFSENWIRRKLCVPLSRRQPLGPLGYRRDRDDRQSRLQVRVAAGPPAHLPAGGTWQPATPDQRHVVHGEAVVGTDPVPDPLAQLV